MAPNSNVLAWKNSTGRVGWQATVQSAAKSGTRLSIYMHMHTQERKVMKGIQETKPQKSCTHLLRGIFLKFLLMSG